MMILPNTDNRKKSYQLLAFVITSPMCIIISHMLFTFELHDMHMLFGLILKFRTVGPRQPSCVLRMEMKLRCAKIRTS